MNYMEKSHTDMAIPQVDTQKYVDSMRKEVGFIDAIRLRMMKSKFIASQLESIVETQLIRQKAEIEYSFMLKHDQDKKNLYALYREEVAVLEAKIIADDRKALVGLVNFMESEITTTFTEKNKKIQKYKKLLATGDLTQADVERLTGVSENWADKMFDDMQEKIAMLLEQHQTQYVKTLELMFKKSIQDISKY